MWLSTIHNVCNVHVHIQWVNGCVCVACTVLKVHINLNICTCTVHIISMGTWCMDTMHSCTRVCTHTITIIEMIHYVYVHKEFMSHIKTIIIYTSLHAHSLTIKRYDIP